MRRRPKIEEAPLGAEEIRLRRERLFDALADTLVRKRLKECAERPTGGESPERESE